MKAWTEGSKWHWFCEEKLPNGKPCKATKFKVDSEKDLDRTIQLHMSIAHNVN